MDREYMYNLIKVITELGLKRELIDTYSSLFNAKRPSVQRQINRIIAYIEDSESQKRSGERNKEKWIASAERVLKEKGIDPERFKVYADTTKLPEGLFRKVYFSDALDAYKYAQVIPRGISQIKYNRQKKTYEVEIASETELMLRYLYE